MPETRDVTARFAPPVSPTVEPREVGVYVCAFGNENTRDVLHASGNHYIENVVLAGNHPPKERP